jgi:hypothetical protein
MKCIRADSTDWARNTSGRISALYHATPAPQSCPTTTACSTPVAATTPTTSATMWPIEYASTAAGALVAYPRMSKAMALNPASATAGNWWRHEYHDSGKP